MSYMSKCALILVDDLNDFDDKVARRFCLATFAELAKSSSKDQLFKVDYLRFLQFIAWWMFTVLFN